jgi:hypothetical protein
MVKLVEVTTDTVYSKSVSDDATGKKYSFREVIVNPDHIVCLREDPATILASRSGDMPADLDKRQSFTRLYIDRGQLGMDIVVVGSPNQVLEKLGLSGKMLKG